MQRTGVHYRTAQKEEKERKEYRKGLGKHPFNNKVYFYFDVEDYRIITLEIRWGVQRFHRAGMPSKGHKIGWSTIHLIKS